MVELPAPLLSRAVELRIRQASRQSREGYRGSILGNDADRIRFIETIGESPHRQNLSPMTT